MADKFAARVSQVSIAACCKDFGLSAVHSAALDTLADVTRRYVVELCRRSGDSAETAGRLEFNALDLIHTFKSLHVDMEELQKYFHFAKDDTFPKGTIPPVPLPHSILSSKAERKEVKGKKSAPQKAPDDDEDDRPSCVPFYLPEFPPRHTYESTSVPREDRGPDYETRRSFARKSAEDTLDRMAEECEKAGNAVILDQSSLPEAVREGVVLYGDKSDLPPSAQRKQVTKIPEQRFVQQPQGTSEKEENDDSQSKKRKLTPGTVLSGKQRNFETEDEEKAWKVSRILAAKYDEDPK